MRSRTWTEASPLFSALAGFVSAFTYQHFGLIFSWGDAANSPYAAVVGFLFGIHPVVAYVVMTLIGLVGGLAFRTLERRLFPE